MGCGSRSRRSGIAWLRSLSSLVLLGAGVSPAFGGAWPVGKSQLTLISGYYRSEADSRIGSAHRNDLYFQKQESNVYLEYGLSDRFTLIGQTAWQQIALRDGIDVQSVSGFSVSRLAVQSRLFSRQRWVGAVQLAVHIPGTAENIVQQDLGEGAYGLETRALVGRSIGEVAYLDVQLGHIIRNEGFPAEQRLDLTVGWRPLSNVSITAQSFSSWTGEDNQRRIGAFDYHKAQLSIGYLREGREWALGVFQTWAGEDALEETGFIVSLTNRF